MEGRESGTRNEAKRTSKEEVAISKKIHKNLVTIRGKID